MPGTGGVEDDVRVLDIVIGRAIYEPPDQQDAVGRKNVGRERSPAIGRSVGSVDPQAKARL